MSESDICDRDSKGWNVMDKETLRKLQLTQLEIAKEFKRICDENKLTYIMEGGTLLGAVRHKGFIPWDDDMDFSMPRKDYDKFFQITQNMTSIYGPVRWDITPSYPHPFGKFVKRDSVYKEEKIDESYGIFIDIFPWDTYPQGKFAQMKYKMSLKIYRALVRAKCGCKTYHSGGKFIFSKWIKNLPFIISAWMFKKEYLIRKYDSLAAKYNGSKGKEMTSQCDMPPGTWNGISDYFENIIEIPFEDTYFYGPEGYDLFLTNGYGDYMQLPPEEKRGNQHLVEKLEFGK